MKAYLLGLSCAGVLIVSATFLFGHWTRSNATQIELKSADGLKAQDICDKTWVMRAVDPSGSAMISELELYADHTCQFAHDGWCIRVPGPESGKWLLKDGFLILQELGFDEEKARGLPTHTMEFRPYNSHDGLVLIQEPHRSHEFTVTDSYKNGWYFIVRQGYQPKLLLARPSTGQQSAR